MGNSLKTIAIFSIIALVLTIISSLFFQSNFLGLFGLVPLILGILIYVGYISISGEENKLLRFSAYALIVLSAIMIIFIFWNTTIAKIPLFLIALFTILLGFGVIGLRKNIGALGLSAGILFVIDGIFEALFLISEQILDEGISIFGSIGNLIGLEVISITNLTYILSIIIFFIYSRSTQYSDVNLESEEGTIGSGYGKSFSIALIVAVAGAIFEAVTGFVTFTLMPDIVFLIVNTIYLFRADGKSRKIGAAIGYLNIIAVVIISVITFFIALSLLDGIGWYTICKACELGF